MTNIRRISEKGLGRLERSFNQLLYHSYGFDTWHIANGSRNRPYKKLLAAQINDLEGKLGLAVEIGCGLGDILSQVDARKRIGCDIDAAAICAARIRNVFRDIEFRAGDYKCITEQKIDAVIAVNWIHGITPSELGTLAHAFSSRTRYFVFDKIDEAVLSSYRYSHDFSFLRKYGNPLCSFRAPGEPRTFLIWRIQ